MSGVVVDADGGKDSTDQRKAFRGTQPKIIPQRAFLMTNRLDVDSEALPALSRFERQFRL